MRLSTDSNTITIAAYNHSKVEMHLSEHVGESYAKHPAFQLGPSWEEPDGEHLRTFSDCYITAQNFGGKLDSSVWESCLKDCGESMHRIFASLRSQAQNNEEEYFVDELERECHQLLATEFEQYRSHRDRKFPLGRNAEVRRDAASMLSRRHFFGHLRPEAVDAILELGKDFLTTFRTNASKGNLTREDLSFNSGGVARRISSILNSEFESLGVLAAVSTYTGNEMLVQGQAFELSVPQAQWWRNQIFGLPRPPRTLYAHLDETIGVPKAIVYLTDVGLENGPVSFAPKIYEEMTLHPLQEIVGRVVGRVGSSADSPLHSYYDAPYHQKSASERFRRHFMKLPSAIRFNSHLGWDIRPGSEAENVFSNREEKMTGPRGTFVVFDGARLFHRGGMLETGERIALQVVFNKKPGFREKFRRKFKKMLR